MGKDTQQENSRTLIRSKVIREFSSGGVVYRDKGRLWLVRATAPSNLFPKVSWMLPKGWIDDAGPGIPGPMASGRVKADEDSLQKAALREVREEAGIEAKIIKKIGTESHFFKHPERGPILKFVTFYLMEYVSNLSEGFDNETLEVAWLPFEEALKKLSFEGERQMLRKARKLLQAQMPL